MITKELYLHDLQEASFKDMINVIAFDEETEFYWNNYIEKMKRPDLLGKTLRVSQKQFPQINLLIEKLCRLAGIDVPEIFVYEDYYYGVESKGLNKPWIEISAKTFVDFNEKELTFLLAREVCNIKHKHTYYFTLVNEVLENVRNSGVIGGEEVSKVWKASFCKWSRLANYTADCYGYLICGELDPGVEVIKKLILNNCFLAENVDLLSYLEQASSINKINDDVANFSKADEQIPYGPFRIKNLIRFASSPQGINAIKELTMGGGVI